ncbi:hypothetical protein Y032_0379g315 [Ancylostoma ceylanicum]|uniref:Uncharacterized protein n=1 Tax=Ancylostoma ceylanicum TaxID=53326 RepID=A0A016RTC1_9BILA|nr:hypothetical protein Y032_0379g315 [Ancylostoma ceylanicum]
MPALTNHRLIYDADGRASVLKFGILVEGKKTKATVQLLVALGLCTNTDDHAAIENFWVRMHTLDYSWKIW